MMNRVPTGQSAAGAVRGGERERGWRLVAIDEPGCWLLLDAYVSVS
mgnify:CR=1 FL=1